LPHGAQAGGERRIALDQDDLRGAARRRLEAERPRAGERVDAAPAVERLAEPGEDRFADAAGRRPKSRPVGDRPFAPLPGAADDAHFARESARARIRTMRCGRAARARAHGGTAMPSRASSAFASRTENSP